MDLIIKGRLVVMFQRLGQRFTRSKQKIGQLRQRESSDLLKRVSIPQQVSSDSLRSLLKTAIADAEQIVASIKMRAQTEAEAEATRIIAQVKLEAEEIRSRAEGAAQKQAEDILSAANRQAEITVEEAKQKALQYIASKEKIEEPVQLREEAVAEKIEQLTQLRDEVAVSEPVEAPTEEHLPEEGPDKGAPEPTPVKLDSHTPYTGEVDLIIAAPVELRAVSKLYNYLQTIPELRILYTRGTWDQGTTITVVLDKPMPLIGLISETPGVEVTPELLGKDDLAKGKPSLPLRAGGKGVKRIKLVLKGA